MAEVVARWVSVVATFESVLKIEVVHLPEALGPIFSQNSGVTQKWLVLQTRR